MLNAAVPGGGRRSRLCRRGSGTSVGRLGHSGDTHLNAARAPAPTSALGVLGRLAGEAAGPADQRLDLDLLQPVVGVGRHEEGRPALALASAGPLVTAAVE